MTSAGPRRPKAYRTTARTDHRSPHAPVNAALPCRVNVPQGVTDWLLDSDPALRWQVLRDLHDAPAVVVSEERARVAVEGWGARLLALRDEDGQWAGGACFPADFRGDFSQGQPWTSTYPTLLPLRELGIEPTAEPMRATIALVRDNCRWEHAGQAFFDGEVEPCINGRTVAL